MAAAYAAIANDGRYNAPHFVEKVTDRDGNVLYEHEPTLRQAIDPDVARQATVALASVVSGGTYSGGRLADGRPGGWQDRHERGRGRREHRRLVRRLHPADVDRGLDRQPRRGDRAARRSRPGRLHRGSGLVGVHVPVPRSVGGPRLRRALRRDLTRQLHRGPLAICTFVLVLVLVLVAVEQLVLLTFGKLVLLAVGQFPVRWWRVRNDAQHRRRRRLRHPRRPPLRRPRRPPPSRSRIPVTPADLCAVACEGLARRGG